MYSHLLRMLTVVLSRVPRRQLPAKKKLRAPGALHRHGGIQASTSVLA